MTTSSDWPLREKNAHNLVLLFMGGIAKWSSWLTIGCELAVGAIPLSYHCRTFLFSEVYRLLQPAVAPLICCWNDRP